MYGLASADRVVRTWLHVMVAHGLMFHHFAGGPHPRGQGAISAAEFEKLLAFYGRGRIIDAREWYERAVQNRLSDDDVCITFDDALRCQYDIAKPVLDRLGITAFWFIYSSAFADGEPPRLELYRYFRTVMFDRMDDFYLAFDQAIAASEYVDIVAEGLRGYDAAIIFRNTPSSLKAIANSASFATTFLILVLMTRSWIKNHLRDEFQYG